MNQIERITEMDRCLHASGEAIEALSNALDAYEANRKSLKKLADYYGSTLWMKDFEADEAGMLPTDLKRGVLSEDTVYDLLTDHHELILRMARIVTKAIEGKLL